MHDIDVPVIGVRRVGRPSEPVRRGWLTVPIEEKDGSGVIHWRRCYCVLKRREGDQGARLDYYYSDEDKTPVGSYDVNQDSSVGKAGAATAAAAGVPDGVGFGIENTNSTMQCVAATEVTTGTVLSAASSDAAVVGPPQTTAKNLLPHPAVVASSTAAHESAAISNTCCTAQA